MDVQFDRMLFLLWPIHFGSMICDLIACFLAVVMDVHILCTGAVVRHQALKKQQPTKQQARASNDGMTVARAKVCLCDTWTSFS
jgi:hypothetical protein